MIHKAILGSLALGATLTAAQATTSVDTQTGEPAAIYSSVCVHPETGDLLGFRVVVMHFPDTTYIMFQAAEGSMDPPELTEATLYGHTVAFALRKSLRGSFSGTITEKSLRGQLRVASAQEALNLPRQLRIAPIPICR